MAARPPGREAAEGGRGPGRGPGPPPGPPAPRAAEAGGSPALLRLSHFSRPPFLCFGDVRVGASRTLPLVLHNPNEEALQVSVARLPAADRGFSVCPRSCVLQSKERISVSIIWTPLKEGRVREMVTFLVNDILKHQAILLGNAEQPKKKKRSLWNTLKKKDISSSRLSKKHSNDKNISDVFNVSQKSGKLRSPLQACENLVVSEDCSFLGSNSLKTEKHKLPVSPVSPELEKSPSEFGTPLSICQSTTYTLLHAPVNSELLNEAQDTNLLKEFHLNEDVISKNTHNTVTKSVQQNVVKGHLDFSDIKLPVFTPDHPSTLHIPHQKTYISPDSFVSDNYLANKDLKSMAILSPEQFMKDDSKDTHTYTFESQRACDIYKPFFQRTILSPDSFVNDSYEQNEDLELLSVDPILSPDQFVKNNMHASQETTDFSQLPSPNAPILKTSLNWKFGSEDQTFPNGILKETRLVEIKLNYSSPSNEDHHKVPAVQKNPSYNVKEQHKRRPILSTTVTKNKPECSERKRIGTNNPKSKRCLTSAITDCENTEIFHASLPTIHPVVNESKSCKDGKVNSFSFGNTFVGHKRKSEGNFEEINAVDSTNEHMEVRETKRIHYSCTKSRTLTVVKTKKAIVRSPASKHVNIREKQNRKKKIDSLGYGPSGFVINKVNKPAVAVAQSHLTFIKPLKTAIPRHPLPFAARNMFYDERWKEKQEQGFTWWLNFILTPDDLTVKAKTSQVNAVSLLLGENHYKASVPRAPTKDEMSLRAYTARCRLNRLRRKACHLFTSEKMVKAIKKLEAEIETRRLLVRKDKHLWKDVGERQKILNWLLSYNPLWLRIGLETVYGELISLENNSDVAGLAIFILNRLLWNPDIAAEYRHPSVPHLYGEGHEEALSRFTLKKLLLLICFLDHAKLSRLIDHDPCLFCKDAEFKASKEILLAFSRDFLSGEGDLSRHLGFLGLPVSHIQTPLDEFDFAVTNLAVDLKCGIRLVRAMELLTKNWNLSNKLRIPAISRLQKINNVDIVLQVLNEYGVSLNDEQGRPIQSKDIVDSHRERTLALLWKIALTFQVDILLNLDQLKEEIVFLKHSLNIKRKINALSSYNNGLTYVKKNRRSSFSLEHHSENVRLLMDWVNAVCAFYSNRVENFTVSFSDGRVLCYLIHHYHPCYVPFEAICQRTTQTVEYAKTDSVALNSSSESDGSSLDICFGAFNNATNSSVIYKELLDNEKKNFHLISTAVRDLGGIPAMIHHADMSNTIPDERVVITYLSFLCARLLDLRKETRAARVIQTSWRKYKIRTNIKLYQEKDKAARIIQAAVTKFLARKQRKKLFNATVIIQKYWRRYLAWRKMLMLRKAKLEKIQNKSAVVIQAFWRRYSIRKWFLKLKYCAIILQARIRMLVAIAAFKQHRWAAITIQRHWRACLRRREDQQKYKMLKSSSLVIQSAFRRWKRRKLELQTKSILVLQRAFRKWKVRKLAKEEKAAVIIQSWYRMQKEKKRYTHIRLSVIIIQSRFRCKQTRKLYIEKKKCILTIQKHYRAYQKGRTERTNYLQKRRAVIHLQSAFRGMKVRQLCRKIRAAWVIQSHYRAYILRKKFLRVKHAIITLQAFIKMKQAHKQYLTLRKSALCIQRWYRSRRYAAQCRDEYQLLRKSSIKLQAVVRGHLVRKQICLQRKAATVLQSYFRMRKEQQHYLRIYRATVCIQSHYRAYQLQIHEREKFLELKKSVVCLQAAYRGYKIRKMFNQKHAAALKIQTAFRGHTTRLKYQTILKSSIKIQQWYRAHKAGYEIRKNFLKTRAAVIFLQSVYRGWKVRKWVQREHNAAIIIQCAFRRVRAQKKFRLMKNAALMIQQHFKTKILEKKQHKAYTDDLYHAVLSLQAVWRGRAIRRQINRQNQSAVIIQSCFRMYICQKKWKATRRAVLRIQRYYKAYNTGKKQYSLYLKIKSATLILQSAYRGMKVRKQMKALHKAAITIQAKYKSYSARKKYLSLQAAAITIQRQYRALVKANHQRWEYLILRNITIKMQAIYKGVQVRRQIHHMHRAATYIKAVFKMYQLRTKYRTMRMAAIVIQVRYRAYRQGKVQRDNYLTLLQATIILQAAFRGAGIRQKLRKMKVAATVIQSHYQKYSQHKYLSELDKGTKPLQQQHCAIKKGSIQVGKYSDLNHSVVCIQAAFRGMKARQHLRLMQLAATLIQRRFRSSIIRKRYLSLKRATILIQRKYRATVWAKREFQEYLYLRKAVIVLQSHYRCFMVKKKVKEMHQAATVIQTAFRRHRAYASYQTMKNTIIISQQHSFVYREGKLQMENYLKQQNSAMVIQAAYRGMKSRQLLQKKHNAAVIIQSSYRMYKQYCYYRDIQWATKVIQRRYRVNKEKKEALQHSFIMKKEATCLQETLGATTTTNERQDPYQVLVSDQKHIKVHQSNLTPREAEVIQKTHRASIKTCVPTKGFTYIEPTYKDLKLQRNFLHMHQSATLIQATFRMYKARAAYRTMRNAAVVIQTYYRLYSKTKTDQNTFLKTRKAILTIQAAFRGMKARQKFKNMLEREMAAIVIQSAFRHYRTKIQLKIAQDTSAVFQSWQKSCQRTPLQKMAWPQRTTERTTDTFHKTIARNLGKQNNDGQRIRPFLHMAMYRRKFLQQIRSALILHAYMRWQTKRQFILYKKAALILENHYRTYLSSKYQRKVHLQTQYSIIRIQARVKGFIQRRKFQKIKDSTIKIQAVWRGYKARQFLRKVRAAKKIQACFRCYKARKEYLALKKAVYIIQNLFYTRLQRIWFLNLRLSTIIIQRRWRTTVVAKKTRERFLCMREATIKIQSAYRGYCVRNQMLKRQKAACLIQAVYQGYKKRQHFLQLKAASVIIQRHFQTRKAGKCERIKYIRMKKGIIMMQALVRGWLVRKKRRFQAREQQNIHIQNCQNIKGQEAAQECWIRRNRAAAVIQRAARNFLLRRREEKLKSGISKIQALWRGYSWRKKNDFSEIKAIRLSLQEANRKSREENKLYKRTALAIHYLLTYKHLSYILEALKHLEVVTRLSPLCCENMAQSGAIAKIFVLILNCNRSIPCMEVITYAVQVLLNVAKYEKTAPSVYEVENCIDTLLYLLQTYREKSGDKVADKGGSIFTKTCCLLAILLKTSRRASDIRSRPKIVNRLCSLYKLTAHKHKICTERIITKQKMKPANGHCFIPPTPIRTKVVSRLKPDWVLRKDNMQEIVNPLQAIQMVMDTLGIPY